MFQRDVSYWGETLSLSFGCPLNHSQTDTQGSMLSSNIHTLRIIQQYVRYDNLMTQPYEARSTANITWTPESNFFKIKNYKLKNPLPLPFNPNTEKEEKKKQARFLRDPASQNSISVATHCKLKVNTQQNTDVTPQFRGRCLIVRGRQQESGDQMGRKAIRKHKKISIQVSPKWFRQAGLQRRNGSRGGVAGTMGSFMITSRLVVFLF